jgi:2,4-dienoyl-CoA reductase-like NADH-dependent reductase (Old Yellow Enzyme family)
MHSTRSAWPICTSQRESTQSSPTTCGNAGTKRSSSIRTPPGGYTGPEALKLIETGAADLVSFASLFLANPDLPRRLQRSGPFNTPDYSLAYGGDHRGYIDYPTLSQATHDDGQQPVS